MSREIEVIIYAQGLPRFIIPVRLLGSIQDIKQTIKMITSMAQESQALCYKKKVLGDDCIVAKCGLYNNCCIQVVPIGKWIKVTIHAKGLESFSINVLLMDNVQVIKQKIQTITSIDKANQKLYYRNQVLQEDCIIAWCGMFDNCHIHLVNIGQDNDPAAYESTPGAAFNGDEVTVSLCYGDFNLPIPCHSFAVRAESCLNVLKEVILANVKKSLVLELPTAKLRVSDDCGVSLADCQLYGKSTIKVLLEWPDPSDRYSTR